jgi:oxygen-independent coproporphyrinogen-3 oxidase
VPDEDETADFYLAACDELGAAGVAQYEISNFARAGFESRHNLKYWTRQPYLGFGVDAHSMLRSAVPEVGAVRLATSDALEKYVSGSPWQRDAVLRAAALEESLFLGLRLNRGVDLREIALQFGEHAVENLQSTIAGLMNNGLLAQDCDVIRLTSRGRMISNEVFQSFLASAHAPANP